MSRRPLSLGLLGTGRMGRLVAEIAAERGHSIALELDSRSNPGGEGLTPETCANVDVLLDFSSPRAVRGNVAGAARSRTNLVLGTTGWEGEPGDRAELETLVRESGIGLLEAPNLSLGISRLGRMLQVAARLVAEDDDADAWLSETHHAGKKDHPSGTALFLGRRLLEGLPWKERLATELPEGPPARAALHVFAERGGHVAGEHRVVLDWPEETLVLTHRARSRRVFASGAVRAAEWLAGRTGWLTLDDLNPIPSLEGHVGTGDTGRTS